MEKTVRNRFIRVAQTNPFHLFRIISLHTICEGGETSIHTRKDMLKTNKNPTFFLDEQVDLACLVSHQVGSLIKRLLALRNVRLPSGHPPRHTQEPRAALVFVRMHVHGGTATMQTKTSYFKSSMSRGLHPSSGDAFDREGEGLAPAANVDT